MGLSHSPSIVTRDLIFYYDASNTNKSWKGAPTTNVVTNAGTMTGWTNYSNTLASSTFITEFGTTGYRFIHQPSWNGILRSITLPATGTYTFSARFKYLGSSTSNNGATFYVSGWGGADSFVAVDKTKVGVWQDISITLNCTNTTMTIYLISFGGTNSGTVNPDFSSWEVTMPQVEAGSFATPFVNGTRSNTQAILDLTGINTVTANSLTYTANNTFNFNGSNNSITINKTLDYIPALSNFTLETWLRVSSYPTAAANNVYGRTDRAGVLFGAAAYAGAALYWTGNSTGTALNIYAYIRGSDAYRITTSKSISLNTWTHLVMVNNYSTSKLQLYVDGELFNETAGPTQEYNAANVPSAGNLGISKSQVDGGGEANYSLLNCEVPIAKIYKKALSAAEVKQNFNSLRGRFGI